MANNPINVVIIGAGARGKDVYAPFARLRPDLMRIAAVAEPDPQKLKFMADEYSIPKDMCFESAEIFFSHTKCADLALIATQDRQHFAHVISALERGYDILLEKPISGDMDECLRIAALANQLGRFVAVCHVLRYTPFYQKIKQILDSGRVGGLVSMQHLEAVGYWHMAHSFVRGNWRDSSASSPMILQKSCHDMDIMLWLCGKQPLSLSSYGSLKYFKQENAPEDSSPRCLDCSAKDGCCYDAQKIYLDVNPPGCWPTNVLCPEQTPGAVLDALRTGPYGRCVFRCDNNVVDHQVVNIRFEDQITASFTMCGFTPEINRETKLMCTNGEIYGNMKDNLIRVHVFGQEPEILNVADFAADLSGHGGGDNKMMEEVLTALKTGKLSGALTPVDVSIQSHVMALLAEQSRLAGGQVLEISNV